MNVKNVFDKTSVNNSFIWDDDPFPLWEADLKELIWPVPESDILRFGLSELDALLGGFRKGSLVVIGGKVGCGKSDLAEMLVYNLCWRQKALGMFFAPRKKDGFTVAGLAAIHARLPFDTVLANGGGKDLDFEKLHSAFQDLSAMRLVLDDRSGLSLRDIKERVRIAKLHYDIDFAAIDKWQNYSNPFRFDDTGVCYLKQMARDFNIPVILFTRMSNTGNKRLTLEDVDDSGFLDHPDAVILMHNDDRNEVGELELEVVKNKYHGLGTVRTAYIDEQHRIENLAMPMS